MDYLNLDDVANLAHAIKDFKASIKSQLNPSNGVAMVKFEVQLDTTIERWVHGLVMQDKVAPSIAHPNVQRYHDAWFLGEII